MAPYCGIADVQTAALPPGRRFAEAHLEQVEACIQEAAGEIDQVLGEAGYMVPVPEEDRAAHNLLRRVNALGAAAKLYQVDTAIQRYAAALAALREPRVTAGQTMGVSAEAPPETEEQAEEAPTGKPKRGRG